MKQIYVILLASLTLVACKQEVTEDEGDIAFIGGEIINPSNDFVILSKSNKVLDTISLDNNNRFLFKIRHLEPGLY